MNQADIEQDINKSIKILLRGLMQGDYNSAYKGHKSLYLIGEPALPALKDLIEKSDWSNKKYKKLSRYITGIFALIRDIDEKEAKTILENLKSNGIPTYIEVQLDSLCSFSLKDYTH